MVFLLFNLNELLFILAVFELNNKNIVKNNLYDKIVNTNNNLVNLNNKVGIIILDISQIFSLIKSKIDCR